MAKAVLQPKAYLWYTTTAECCKHVANMCSPQHRLIPLGGREINGMSGKCRELFWNIGMQREENGENNKFHMFES